MPGIRRNSETAGGAACECYVNAAEIQQGRWQEDPSECLRHCKAQFLRRTLDGWTETAKDHWVNGCKSLNRGAAAHEFWSLYWCDLTFCGVGIDPARGLGQDPNVDLIINTCQNIGAFRDILDPGPPPPGFRCSTEAETHRGCSVTMLQVPQALPSSLSRTAPPPVLTSSTTPRTTTTTATRAKPTPVVVVSQPTSAPPVATASSTPTAASAAASTTSGSNLTAQGKAAIGVCSVLALILVICLALVCLRRRKRRKASFHRALRSRRGLTSHDVGPAGSPTPLISPANSAIGTRTILTPPLRLRDRRFLPSILRSGSRSPSPPLTPLTPAYSPQPGGGGAGAGIFPSPTTSKLISRHERAATPRTYTPTTYHPTQPPPFPTITTTTTTGGGGTPSPSRRHHLSPEATFTLPIPVPGTTSPWPPPYLNNPNSNPSPHNRGSSASSGSCYTGTGGGASTAHSSLRGGQHEIPIAVPLFMAAGGGREGTPPPPPPSPCRPPRPHEGMLEVPGLVTPAGVGYGYGYGGGGGGASGDGVGMGYGGKSVWDGARAGSSVGTPPPPPPPPPPLSPPPTRALPQTPPVVPSPPPLSLRGLAVSGSPPPPYSSSGRSIGRGGKSPPPPTPPPRLLGVRSPLPSAGPRAGTGQFDSHDYGYGRPAGHSLEQAAIHSGAKGRGKDARGSWGSWSGAGTMVGSPGDHVGGHDGGVRGAVGTGVGGESKGEAVSPRTSESSGVTATGEMAVSRMSSMRDETIGGRI